MREALFNKVSLSHLKLKELSNDQGDDTLTEDADKSLDRIFGLEGSRTGQNLQTFLIQLFSLRMMSSIHYGRNRNWYN